MAQEINLNIKADTRSARNDVNNLTGDVKRLGQEGGKSQKQLTNMGKGGKDMQMPIRGAGVDMRNLSYQIQDVAVQAGMGTDALRILSMQGPQIASAFGPAGAAYGAVIAIGAALAGALLPSLLNGKDAFEELGESIDEFGGNLEMNGLKLKGFSDDLIQMSEASQSATLIALNSQIADLKMQSMEASQAINNMSDGFFAATTTMRRQAEELESYNNQFDAMGNKINETSPAYQTLIADLNEFERLVDQFSVDNALVTQDQLLALLDRTNNEGLKEQIRLFSENAFTVSEAQAVIEGLLTAENNLREGIALTNQTISTQAEALEQLNVSARSYNDLQSERSLVMTDTNALMQQEEEAALNQVNTQDKVKDAILKTNSGKIISSSYSAAMAAYEALAGIPVVGPALGAVAAAKIIATGAMYASQSLAGRALGGQVRGGESYIVGERGPEVLTMGSSRGFITPNDQLRSQTVNNAGNVANVTFNITANDTAGFDELLNKRRGQIIGIVNQALNNSGRRALV